MEHSRPQFNYIRLKKISLISEKEKIKLLKNITETIPFIDFVGIEFDLRENELTARLPFKPTLIGNDMIKALHGGAIGSFLESVAIVQLAYHLNLNDYKERKKDEIQLPKTIDFTIDYILAGMPQTSYAKAKVNRSGKRYASVSVAAWQSEKDVPFAQAIGHFLVP